MPSYNSLSPEEKEILDTWSTEARAFAGGFAQLLVTMGVLVDDWNGQVSAIVTTLNPNERVPNKSGLRGAARVTKEEFTSLYDTLLPGLLTTHDTDAERELRVRMAGPSNVLSRD